MIDLAVFDLAGTTVKDNQDVQRVLQQTLTKYNIHITLEEGAAVMGIPKPVAIRQLLEKHGNGQTPISSDYINEIHAVFVHDMVTFYKTDPSIEEKEGVSETFAALKKSGIKVAVDTGFDRLITDVLLDRLGWLKNNLIDYSVTSDEVPRGRPFPDLVHKAMEHLRVNDPARVAKIGDTPVDLQEGNAAGCGLVIGITTGAFSREMLQTEEHTHLIDAIPEVLSIVNSYMTSQTV